MPEIKQPEPVSDKLPDLRETLEFSRQPGEANWKRTQFSPQVLWHEVSQIKRAIAELQDRMTTLINRINNCKDC